MPSISKKFGRYTLTERIARGGMGEIYLASLEGVAGFEKQCVIKKILPDLASDDTFIERFLNEGRTLVALTHSNIVQIFDMGEVNGEYYLAMEYVSGADLRCLLKKLEPQTFIPIDITIAIVLETLKGLGHAHQAKDKNGIPLGIVHRDISPSNILISENGEVKLIDFGIAKARTVESCTGLVQGKFAYMSPEQARGESLDARTDIFSLGIVLYEMLTNIRPFEGNSDLQCLEYIKFNMPTPISQIRPGLDSTLETIVNQALAKDKAHRFQSAEAFYDALDDFARNQGYKAGQREIMAYFKPMLAPDMAPVMNTGGINDVLDAMLQAQMMNANMTRTQTITPQKKEDLQFALANTGSVIHPLDDTLTPHHVDRMHTPSENNPEQAKNRDEAQISSTELENVSYKHDLGVTPISAESLKKLQVLEELPSADLAIIEEAALISEDARKQIQRRRMWNRIKYTLVGAGLMLIAMGGYGFYRWSTLDKAPETVQDVAQKSTDQTESEQPHKAPHLTELPKDTAAGIPFAFQTTPDNATIYVVDGKYHALEGKRVILEFGQNAEIAIQAPGYETCFMHVQLADEDKVSLDHLKWQNCASGQSQFSLQNQQVELTANLIPIRAARPQDPNTLALPPQKEAEPDNAALESPNSAQTAEKPESPKAQPVKSSRSKSVVSSKSAPKPQTQAVIKHTVQTSRAATVVVEGIQYDLPGNIEILPGTRLQILPKVTGKTAAIPQTIIWQETAPDAIAFCDVKVRIRESYVPGDPAPYQIADIAIDGKLVAKQTDFASIVLPCGKHEAEAKIQAGSTLLQSKIQFTTTTDAPLTLPMTLKP